MGAYIMFAQDRNNVQNIEIQTYADFVQLLFFL